MDFLSPENLKAMFDTYVVPFAINLVLAALVFFFGRIVARVIVRLVDKLLNRANVDESLRKFLGDVIYSALLVVVVIAALERLGVKTTAAVAVLGAAGLAIGLALQGSLGNFASGVMIVGFRPYSVGDVVSVAGLTGKVEAVKIFNTVLMTPDNRRIIVPNGSITSGPIENITAMPTRRIDLVFGIGYGDDIDKAREIINKVLAAETRLLPDPEPQVAVAELADSSVNFVVRPWVKTEDYWGARFDLIETMKKEFDANGISIPFPQQDVHMHQVAA